MKRSGVIQHSSGLYGFAFSSPTTATVWLVRDEGRILLGELKIGLSLTLENPRAETYWLTFASTLGVQRTTVGPCDTLDACIGRAVERWQQLREAAV